MSENTCNAGESGPGARARASTEGEATDSGGDSFQGITIIGKYVAHMSGRYWPLAGASAAVESAQSAGRRLIPDRIVVGRLLLPPPDEPAPAYTLSPDHPVLVVELPDQSAIVVALTP